MMYNRAIIIGTMLVPTVGHLALIRFASNLAYKTTVLIQGRSHEPVYTYWRAEAIRAELSFEDRVDIIVCKDDNAPQRPDPLKETFPGADTEFWNYWIYQIEEQTGRLLPNDVIIASESYGQVLADKLGCVFLPFDIKREMYPVSGTDVRNDIYGQWDNILPTLRPLLRVNAVMFGQESVGKTTIARALSQRFMRARFIPEYARGYLEFESVGPEVNLEKMHNISLGQMSLERMAIDQDTDAMTNFFDTDILSTIGYYRLFMNQGKPASDEYFLYPHFRNYRNRKVYCLLPDDIPFERDILRYGGDKRESSYQFWLDLLNEFQCNRVEVPSGLSLEEKLDYISVAVEHVENELVKDIREFERE